MLVIFCSAAVSASSIKLPWTKRSSATRFGCVDPCGPLTGHCAQISSSFSCVLHRDRSWHLTRVESIYRRQQFRFNLTDQRGSCGFVQFSRLNPGAGELKSPSRAVSPWTHHSQVCLQKTVNNNKTLSPHIKLQYQCTILACYTIISPCHDWIISTMKYTSANITSMNVNVF